MKSCSLHGKLPFVGIREVQKLLALRQKDLLFGKEEVNKVGRSKNIKILETEKGGNKTDLMVIFSVVQEIRKI